MQRIGIMSLYSYWVDCNDLLYFAHNEFSNQAISSRPLDGYTNLYQCFHRKVISYALLYVVIEGYLELKLEDSEIDVLLMKDGYVSSLKKLRHSKFHFQKNTFETTKLWNFVNEHVSEIWISELHKAFERFLIKQPELIRFMSKNS